MKKIILTGGGTAGHVMPNFALLPGLKERGYEILYVGSISGIEKGLCEEAGLDYAGISSGKLRRYFDLKNFTDPFRVIKGYFEAKRIIKKFKPDVVFSKGGFVAVPVTLAASRLKVPVVEHESDLSPGLANRISAGAAEKICVSFPETLEFIKDDKGVLTGLPVREELLGGDRDKGLRLIGADGSKPVLFIIGGSLGAEHINEAVREALPGLLDRFDICHIVGKGHLKDEFAGTAGYTQFEFAGAELKDLYAAADIFVSRAGANVISEILALRKPSILIPLPAAASRGDQILNAASFGKRGYAVVLEEENMTGESLSRLISETYDGREKLIDAMQSAPFSNGIEPVLGIIEAAAAGKSKEA